MSRNINTTCCSFCGGDVGLVEPAREITKAEAGIYYETHQGYGYARGLFANAVCVTCNAKYLAWIDLSKCDGYGAYSDADRLRCEERGFFDLSHREAFNDEPRTADLPDVIVEWERVAHKTPWPTCGCGAKKHNKRWTSTGADWACRDCEDRVRSARQHASVEWEASG